jgi:hypothetical protein
MQDREASSSSINVASMQFLRTGRSWTVSGWVLHFISNLGIWPNAARRAQTFACRNQTSFSLRARHVLSVNILHHLHTYSRRKVAAVRERSGSLNVGCARAAAVAQLFSTRGQLLRAPACPSTSRKLCRMAADRQTGEGFDEVIEEGTRTSTPITCIATLSHHGTASGRDKHRCQHDPTFAWRDP